MRTVPSDQFPQRDKAGLHGFLAYCQEEARRDGQPKVASISLEVKHIDPLAVIESIYEKDELHFYMEHPTQDFAVAGAEAIFSKSYEGSDRFQKIKTFTQHVLENTIAIGDLNLPFAGPHFFCGFTFFDEPESETCSFKPATVFLPRWQVARHHEHYVAVANVPITAECDVDFLAEKVWAAHGKFSSFDYEAIARGQSPEINEEAITEVGGDAWFEDAIKNALLQISAGHYNKIVLARAIDLVASSPFQPLEALNNLRESFPSCYSFSFANEKGDSFIGATPERLVKVEKGRLLTEAIAGSAARGENASEDANCARELLSSDKDKREHGFVIESIRRRLSSLGIKIDSPQVSKLIKLKNVQHLKTALTAQMPESVHFMDALDALHPTPAVGGVPREIARRDIKKKEPFERGLYAGTLGWFNAKGEGEMVVGIRSALIQQEQARLYAGVGIVKGSKPAREKIETNWKLQALLKVLQK